MNSEDLSNLLKPFGQTHLVQFWSELNAEEREHLRHDILSVDLADLNRSFNQVKDEMTGRAQELDGLMKPVAESAKGSWTHSNKEHSSERGRMIPAFVSSFRE